MKKLRYFAAAAVLATNLAFSVPACTPVKEENTVEVKEEKVEQIYSFQGLEEKIAENKYVVVDIGSNYCRPCKEYSETFKAVSKEYDNIEFYKVVLDETEGEEVDKFNAKFKIEFIPLTVFFKEGKEVRQYTGNVRESKLKDLIENTFK